MELPYYISWAKQKNAKTFEIYKVDGVNLWCENNHHIIDLSSISYQAHFGHNHPQIIKALKDQLDTIPMSSPKGAYPNKKENTDKLLKYLNLDRGKIFYTTGGAETIENALKIARHISKKKIVLARSNSYHGATMGALAVTGDWRNPPHQLPREWVIRIPEPTEENALLKTEQIIKETGAENIAALIIETITGGNGVIIPTKEWIEGIDKLCKKNNILFILDEVICGFHRTGTPFGFNHYNLNPDLVCMAKGITGGMIPFGALWTSEKIAQFYQEEILCCGLTNYAHPMGMAAMGAVLDIVNESHFQIELKKRIDEFKFLLEKLKELKQVKGIRQIGLIAAVDLNQTIDWNHFYQGGIYLVAQTNRIILAPPLIIKSEELKLAMDRLNKIIGES